MNLQPLFDEKIISQEELSPGYENHSSDVWLVKTVSREVIVRAFRSADEDDGPFWGGCRTTFGINPENVHAQECVNSILDRLTDIRIPRVIGKGVLDREYIIVEKLDGSMLTTFNGQSEEMLYSLGVGLGQIHQKRMNYIGNPQGRFRVELDRFREHLICAMENMVERYYSDDDKIVSALPELSNLVRELPLPEWTSFILVDMDPTQFLTDGKVVTGLVDTEAYAVGPRELDLVALEYVLDQESGENFIKGYETVLDIPNLDKSRTVYRYLYRLIEIQGREDLDGWLNYPILF